MKEKPGSGKNAKDDGAPSTLRATGAWKKGKQTAEKEKKQRQKQGDDENGQNKD